jgi:translation initiation factor IF-2
MRVFELAKELETTSKVLLARLGKLGIKASNHMSALSEAEVAKAISSLKKGGSPPKQSEPKLQKQEKKTKSPKPSKKKESLMVEEPSPRQKKGRILIKKRTQPEEVLSEVPSIEKKEALPEVSKEVAEKPSVDEPVIPQVEKKGERVVLQKPSGLEPETEVKAELKEPLGEIEAVPVPKSPELEVSLSGEPSKIDGIEGKGEKPEVERKKSLELVKGDLSDVTRKKEKEADQRALKKVKKVKKAREESARESYQDIRRWQTFKPIHKKTGRARDADRGSAQSSVSDITKPRKKVVKLSKGITVKDFAEIIGQKATEIIAKMMEMGMMATINQPIDLDVAVLISSSYGLNAEVVEQETIEDLVARVEDDPSSLVSRWPVVTIMGHVDHGKTSLLDAIRQTKVTDSEAGGITQHIGAYSVSVGDKNVVFLDTPGHEAFTAMRARGAKVTDIVILVVAADDGVMPQTIEAINHSKAANVPIIVAINKIDKPEANPERIRNILSERGLIPEAWGGQTIFAEVSAKKRLGLEQLLEMVLLQSDVLELKANPNRAARGNIVEAKIDKGRGAVATVLVQEGTLRVGDPFVTGSHHGRVRALINDKGKKVQEAPPSTPVEVIGLTGVPLAGDSFVVVENEKVARDVANTRMQRQRNVELSQYRRVTLDDLYSQIKEGEVKELNIVVKADVQGSVEAVVESLEKLSTQTVRLRTIHGGAGGITETDVLLASASNAIIIGFNIRPEPKAAALAEKEKVDIRLYSVIYDAINDVKAAMEGLLEPTFKERTLGRVEVRQTFTVSKIGMIAGSYVLEGVIARNSSGARVVRDSKPVYEGKISSLKRFKDDVKEVQAGYECGIGIENFNDIKVGDIIEVFTLDKVAGKL